MTVKTRVWFDSDRNTYRVSIRRGFGPVKWWSEVLETSQFGTKTRRSFNTFEKAKKFASHCATDIIFEHRANDYAN
jgi:hypothetical protein